jgi:hypothetical protein
MVAEVWSEQPGGPRSAAMMPDDGSTTSGEKSITRGNTQFLIDTELEAISQAANLPGISYLAS